MVILVMSWVRNSCGGCAALAVLLLVVAVVLVVAEAEEERDGIVPARRWTRPMAEDSSIVMPPLFMVYCRCCIAADTT